MNALDVSKFVSENGPTFLALLFISAIAQLIRVYFYCKDAKLIRSQLGRALDRFVDVPAERFDLAIVEAAKAARRGGVNTILNLAEVFLFTSVVLSGEKLLNAILGKSNYEWLWTVGLCFLVSLVLRWCSTRLERRTILRRLEPLLQPPAAARPGAL
jgi:hypothetical protein